MLKGIGELQVDVAAEVGVVPRNGCPRVVHCHIQNQFINILFISLFKVIVGHSTYKRVSLAFRS